MVRTKFDKSLLLQNLYRKISRSFYQDITTLKWELFGISIKPRCNGRGMGYVSGSYLVNDWQDDVSMYHSGRQVLGIR